MKILQITRTFHPAIGGIESVTEGLAVALQALGHRSDVLTLRHLFASGRQMPAFDNYRGLQIYRLPHLGGRRYPVAPGVLEFARSYDLLHIHAIDFFVDFLTATRRFHGRPIVVNTHGGIFHTRWLIALKRLFFATVTRRSLRHVACVICDSEHDRELFARIVPEHKLRVIRNGVDVTAFAGIEKRVEPGLLVGIGRLVENKRVERLVELVAALAAERPDLRLIWVGDDEQGRGDAIRARASELGVGERITLVGQVPPAELQALLARAHLFVSAASYEAFGISTIEAMSSATLPVVTPVGVHPEVVREGETGFLLDPGDDGRAVETLRRALALEPTALARIGAAARAAARRFAWETVVHEYLDVYAAAVEAFPAASARL